MGLWQDIQAMLDIGEEDAQQISARVQSEARQALTQARQAALNEVQEKGPEVQQAVDSALSKVEEALVNALGGTAANEAAAGGDPGGSKSSGKTGKK